MIRLIFWYHSIEVILKKFQFVSLLFIEPDEERDKRHLLG